MSLLAEVVRPSLRLAFPLHPEPDLDDQRFQRVLETVAQRHGQATSR